MEKPKLFNPQGQDAKEYREIFGGNSTNIINLSETKFNWAKGIWRQMREQFWIAEKVDVTQDVVDYNNLLEQERKAYNGILSYLTFLDSIQVNNLAIVSRYTTAPEVKACLSEQISQETLHSQSYSYIIESILPPNEANKIYDFWREDKILYDRCETIAKYYQLAADNPTEENFFYSLIGDYLLEGIYFFNGFAFFYTLLHRQLMPGTADIIKYINRDEQSHIRLFQKIIIEAKSKLKFSVQKVQDMVAEAVDQEIAWTNHIADNSILGISESSTEQYSKYLANLRLKAIGIEPIYEETKNPYSHLEKIANTGKDAHVKANFFETTVSEYQMSTAIDGWDLF